MAHVTIIEEKKTFEPFIVKIEIETREELEEFHKIVGLTNSELLFTDAFYDVLVHKLNKFS